MHLEITLTAPGWLGPAVTLTRVENINERLERLSDDMDYCMYAEQDSDMLRPETSIVFVIADIDHNDVQSAIKLMNGLILEEFDVEFE